MDCPLKPKTFAVPHGRKTAILPKLPTVIDPWYKNKKTYRKLMDDYTKEMDELQRVLYAQGQYSLLIIFQGMDTAGKDGAIRHVMSGVNPQGCQVRSFKQPSLEELNHDYLWRSWKHLPERGHIGIFNRSYYEEVLIVKAEPKVLARQPLPDDCRDIPDFWEHRYSDITHFENFLHRNGTRVVKFYLHLSKEEQRQRLLSRAKESEKHWKISSSDLTSRAQWDTYAKVYDECLRSTSHAEAPWYVIPADDKKNARLIISHIIVETLKALPLKYPEPDEAQLAEVEKVRKALEESD
jgi:PPK2 family polyphosphate:nucleotide phosphotransferase